MNKTPQVRVVPKEGEEPLPVHIIEASILEIAEAMKKISQSRLKRETLVTLLHDSSKVGKTDIRIILNNLDQLESIFLKPKI